MVWVDLGHDTWGLKDGPLGFVAHVVWYRWTYVYRVSSMGFQWSAAQFDTPEEAMAMAVVAYKMGG